MQKAVVTFLVCVMSMSDFVLADNIRGINIDFVNVGNAGNDPDTRVMQDGTTGYGVVEYNYRIGKYEVTNEQWNAFTSVAGSPMGYPSDAYDNNAIYTDAQQPTNGVSWYETLQFCNYLTSGDKSRGVYQFSGDNTNPGEYLGIDRLAAQSTYGTIYCLPTEDEWYKAAYYKHDNSGYSLYANGQNSIPTADNGWNYVYGSYSEPWDVGTGTEEQNGTFDMMGNVWEWNETLVPDTSFGSEVRGLRGGSISDYDAILASSARSYSPSNWEYDGCVGFRIASIPEPTTISFFLLGGMGFIRKYRRK